MLWMAQTGRTYARKKRPNHEGWAFFGGRALTAGDSSPACGRRKRGIGIPEGLAHTAALSWAAVAGKRHAAIRLLKRRTERR